MEISVVIPVYNASNSLDELTRRIVLVLEKEFNEFEIIYVNDCSSDNSWEILKELGASISQVKIINLTKNRGQQIAVVCGLNYASGNFVVTMDDDLQHDPSDIVKMYGALVKSDVDAVIASFDKKKHSLLRNLGTRIVRKYVSSSLGVSESLELTSFRIIRKSIVSEMCKIQNSTPVVGFLLFEITNKIKNFKVTHHKRDHSKSSYSVLKLIKLFLSMLNNHLYLPLSVMYWGGIFLTIISFLTSIVYFVRYILGSPVPGFTTISLLLLLILGVISFGLGVIGKYMIKIIKVTEKTPFYSIRESNFLNTN